MAKRKYLNEAEMLQLELFQSQIQNKNTEIENVKLNTEILKRNIKLIENEIVGNNNKILSKKNELENVLKKSKENHEKLKTIFKVSKDKKIGFNPDTGEVIYE